MCPIVFLLTPKEQDAASVGAIIGHPQLYNKSSDEREQLPLGFPGGAKKEEGRVTR